ncbi:MAG TPA: tetratricopeptide repeat protein [Tepidisphaeraceae bacterium]|nr:tetratricopeptide repeat protein [Tepidisphaeraceae bacterium]
MADSDVPQGYKDIPEEDRKKAEKFFDYGRSTAGTGNYDYAIELYLNGLRIDPENTDAHKALRDVSLRRKASGGKDLGMFEKMKLKRPVKDDKENMLNAEKLLAYDPGNTDHMVSLIQNAHRAGFFDTVLWVGPELQKANSQAGKGESVEKYVILKDVYKSLERWKEATDACHYALRLKPDDMELQTEVKNLGAQYTMTQGNYDKRGSFRDSVRNMAGQQKLLNTDKGVASADVMARMIADARADYEADPNEPGKLMKLVDVLVKTEQPEHEEQAIGLLDDVYQRTKNFRFRHAQGRIRIVQLNRKERSLYAAYKANPQDAAVAQELQTFLQERWAYELDEYRLWAEHYPTDSSHKFQVADKLFKLKQFGDAIPVLQQVRADPKHRAAATILLGQSFLGAGFTDEAVETLKSVIDEYPVKGDERSIEMHYWYGRGLEAKGDAPTAIKAYSQVAQWNFNYRDVQARIKKLRAA